MKEIEFLPEHHIQTRLNQRLRFTRMWLLVALAMSMVCWALYSRIRIEVLGAELEHIESQMSVVEADVQRMAQLGDEKKVFAARERLVKELEEDNGGPRAAMVKAIAEKLPEEIVLTRLEIGRRTREVPVQQGMKQQPRRGAKVEMKTEILDRVHVEGFAADDLSLARFLQRMADSKVFRQGQLAFSKDAKFRERDVRVFAATFYVAPEDAEMNFAQWVGGMK